MTVLKNSSASAPVVADGLAPAIFLGVQPESHPDWAGPGMYGFDDGERWRFGFQLVDSDEAVLRDYASDEPLIINTLTKQTIGKNSNARALMTGLMSKAEAALVEAGEDLDDSILTGRACFVNIAHNQKGWPSVSGTFPRVPGKPITAAVKAAAAAAEAPAPALDISTTAADADAAKAAQRAALEAQLAALG